MRNSPSLFLLVLATSRVIWAIYPVWDKKVHRSFGSPHKLRPKMAITNSECCSEILGELHDEKEVPALQLDTKARRE